MRRDRLNCRHLDAGVPLKALAVAAGISLQTASNWSVPPRRRFGIGEQCVFAILSHDT